MGRKKKYDDETQMRAAVALNKKLKRAAIKEQKEAEKTNDKFIFEYLLEVADQVTTKVERRIADAKQRATKRSAIKEAANILPKRQKYAK